ncbi:TetR/AcrR family transcriptional regulator [Pilimelia columellifera]|uniref:TetR/AcrR family transcriptional regulator n=1 Tax=Pilimelia columellifera subsp. columellifera TaxID=706583 RepID=A0ABN3NS58_9ACTN
MPSNPERRAQLADAGLRILAAGGARGLTHRAVDRAAGVPLGTASNYFGSRNSLLIALGQRVFERLAPDPERVSALAHRQPDVSLFTDYMRYIVERAMADPEVMLALMELRLEATRRPELRGLLGDVLQRNYHANIAFSQEADFTVGPGDIALMQYAMDGLLLDMLTPSIDADHSTEDVVATLTQRLLRSTDING